MTDMASAVTVDSPIDAVALEMIIQSLDVPLPLHERMADIALGILLGLGMSVAAPEWARSVYLDEIRTSETRRPGMGVELRTDHEAMTRRIAAQFPVTGATEGGR